MLRLIATLLLLCNVVNLYAFESIARDYVLPGGWRLVNAKDVGSKYQKPLHREKYTEVVADFNNDSFDDLAILLKGSHETKEALFVRLTLKEGYRWIKIYERIYPFDSLNLTLYIELLPEGNHEIFCKSDINETGICNKLEDKELLLNTPGIYVYMLPVASGPGSKYIFYWSTALKAFLSARTNKPTV